LVFSDDWGRHPSSCQHLIRHLLPRRQTRWVNTIGTRAPRLNWSTFRRGIDKLRQWAKPRRDVETLPDNLRVLNPQMWPWFRSSFDRWLNRRLLRKQICAWLQDLPQPPIGVTTVPIVADIVRDLPVKRWVYYCVDDFSQWPGLDQATMAQMEGLLLKQVDGAVAASPVLQDRLARLGRPSVLLTHGVDLDLWQQPSKPLGLRLDNFEHPLVLFFGLIDGRLDTAFLKAAAEQLTHGTLLLVGPQDPTAPDLNSLPRVTVLPPLSFDELPALAREADVLIMPYANLPVTRAMQPLKLKEYLATGKPAVVRDLPANREWTDCLDVCATAEQFATLVNERLRTGLPAAQAEARRRLAAETWAEKAAYFSKYVQGDAA